MLLKKRQETCEITEYDVNQIIFQLERDIAGAEKNISQLMSLKSSCNNYQTEFESSRLTRKSNLKGFYNISGQQRLVDAYGVTLEELLDGTQYINALRSLDTAKTEIDREIERQRQIINECSCKIVDLNRSISDRSQSAG